MMNPKKMNCNKLYNTAFHEAAYAIMCIMKMVPVTRLFVNEEEDKDGRLGCCVHHACDDPWDSAWIALAGPAGDCINKNVSMTDAFIFGGSSDFDNARAKFGELLYPKVPIELENHIGKDVRAYLELWYNEWRPEGVSGLLKRKLTLFTKQCVKADDFICDLIHRQASLVKDYLRKAPGVLEAIRHLADHLVKVRQMNDREILEVLQNKGV